MDRTGVNRREFLRAGAVAGAAGIAGCTGGDGSGSLEPADDLPCVQAETSPSSSLSAGFLSGALPFGASQTRGGSPSAERSAQAVPLTEIPVELHRRAAGVIEDAREGGLAPGWEGARLRDAVRPFSRPDVDGVAYYEFGVDPAGFVVLSTGVHDFPVPHWNDIGDPVSRVLERGADGAENVSRVYRLDTLTYAAESENEERVARYGPRMVRVEGLTREWFEDEGEGIHVVARPNRETDDDGETDESIEYVVERTGPKPHPVALEPWESWRELKEGYGEVYAPLLAELRREARREWAVYERPRRLDAEVVPRATVALLYPDAEVDLSGDVAGAARIEEFVRVEVRERDGSPAVVELTLVEEPDGDVPFSVHLSYPNGRREEIEFVITGSGRRGRVYAGGTGATDDAGTVQTVSCGGGYTLHSAGRPIDQRMYHEFVADDGCEVGAGAVAWAMLFGWADHQAARGIADWSPRWGLFRENGGTRPGSDDAHAPRIQTSGIEAVIEEIHRDVNRCAPPTSMAHPVDMDSAVDYFVDRTWTRLDTWSKPYKYRDEARDRTVESIKDRKTPAVIGTGLGSHYLLAWRYATKGSASGDCQELFYVNQGRGTETDPGECLDNGHGWIPAKAWFWGGIFPSSDPEDF